MKRFFTQYVNGAYNEYDIHSLKGTAKDVLLYIMQSRCIQDGTQRLIYRNTGQPIKQSNIVQQTGNNKSAVCKAMKELEEHGIIAKDNGGFWCINHHVATVGNQLRYDELKGLPTGFVHDSEFLVGNLDKVLRG